MCSACDALVTRSLQLDEIPRARLSSVASAPVGQARVFIDEALSLDPEIIKGAAYVKFLKENEQATKKLMNW